MASIKYILLMTLLVVCSGQPLQHNEVWKFHRMNDSAMDAVYLEFYNTFNIEELIEHARKVYKDDTVSGNCLSDSETVVAGLKSNDTILRMISITYIDAASKIPHGILQGKSLWVGDYQECLSLDSIDNSKTGRSFSGKYFTVTIELSNSPIPTIHFGICLPDSCSEEDSIDLMNTAILLLETREPVVAQIKPTATAAYTRKSNEIKGGVLATIVISVLIFLLVAAGTILGLLYPNQRVQARDVQEPFDEQTHLIESQPSLKTYLLEDDFQFRRPKKRATVVLRVVINILKTFSFFENAKKLFGTETAHGPLACLNGLRVISMWWVILGHTYEFGLSVLDNPLYTMQIGQRFSFQPVLNGTLSVDTFFFLSGLLVAYIAMKEIREKGKMNWLYFILHRYWRLTPLYAFVILFFANIANLLLYGPIPLDKSHESVIQSCKTYWWTNLLYINNMYPNYGSLTETCLPWSWYLANDMQFYIFLSPIVLLLLWRRRNIGIVVTSFLIIGCIFSRGFLVIYYGTYAPNFAVTKHQTDPWTISSTYIRPYTRWSVYLIGMLTGYWLAAKNSRIKIGRVMALVGWCAAISVSLAVVFGQYYYYHHPGTKMTLTGSVLYQSLDRSAWGLCLSWVVLACVSGNGGPVKHILSWAVWAPLGRLTYAAYLVHPIILIVYYFNLQTPLHFTDLTVVYIYIGNLVMTYGIAFVVSMAVEAPMIQLEKAVLKMFKKKV